MHGCPRDRYLKRSMLASAISCKNSSHVSEQHITAMVSASMGIYCNAPLSAIIPWLSAYSSILLATTPHWVGTMTSEADVQGMRTYVLSFAPVTMENTSLRHEFLISAPHLAYEGTGERPSLLCVAMLSPPV